MTQEERRLRRGVEWGTTTKDPKGRVDPRVEWGWSRRTGNEDSVKEEGGEVYTVSKDDSETHPREPSTEGTHGRPEPTHVPTVNRSLCR